VRNILKWLLEKLDSTGRRWNRNAEKYEFIYSTDAGNYLINSSTSIRCHGITKFVSTVSGVNQLSAMDETYR
jgi:hypothetical protein